MLFDPRSNFDLFLALGGVVLALVMVLPPAVAELGVERGHWAALLCAGVAIPLVANLLRYRKAKLGCAVVPLGFVLCGIAWGLQRPWTERALLLGAPNLLFFAWEFGVAPLVAWRSALAGRSAVAAAVEARELGPYLAHADPMTRALAGEALAKMPWRDAIAELGPAARSEAQEVRDAALYGIGFLAAQPDAAGNGARELLLELAGGADPKPAVEAAHVLGELDPGGEACRRLIESKPSSAVGAALVVGRLERRAIHGEEGERIATVIVATLADPEAPDGSVESVLEAIDPEEGVFTAGDPEDTEWTEALDVFRGTLLREARGALHNGGVTPGLLWLLVGHGLTADAPLAASAVASEDYPTAVAAIEAVEAVTSRADDDLGEHAVATRAALTAGRDRLREVHPPGDNMLADRLVARLEGLLEATAPS